MCHRGSSTMRGMLTTSGSTMPNLRSSLIVAEIDELRPCQGRAVVDEPNASDVQTGPISWTTSGSQQRQAVTKWTGGGLGTVGASLSGRSSGRGSIHPET